MWCMYISLLNVYSYGLKCATSKQFPCLAALPLDDLWHYVTSTYESTCNFLQSVQLSLQLLCELGVDVSHVTRSVYSLSHSSNALTDCTSCTGSTCYMAWLPRSSRLTYVSVCSWRRTWQCVTDWQWSSVSYTAHSDHTTTDDDQHVGSL